MWFDGQKKCRKHNATCGREPSKEMRKAGESGVKIELPGRRSFVVSVSAIGEYWPGCAKMIATTGRFDNVVLLADELHHDRTWVALVSLSHRNDIKKLRQGIYLNLF